MMPLVANAKLAADGDEEAYAECLLDLRPELARIERGRARQG